MAAIYPDLSGKVALVTGGGSGIGEWIVRRLAEQGVAVGFIDLKQAESRSLAHELTAAGRRVRFEPADLTDITALRDAIRRVSGALGPIDILINNAANDERHATEDVTPEYWDGRIA